MTPDQASTERLRRDLRRGLGPPPPKARGASCGPPGDLHGRARVWAGPPAANRGVGGPARPPPGQATGKGVVAPLT